MTAIRTISVPAGMIWLASYPKSGEAWLRLLLSRLLSGARPPASEDRSIILDSYLQSGGLVEFARVHDPWVRRPDGAPQMGRAGRAGLYVARAPRDVAVSLSQENQSSLGDVISQMAFSGQFLPNPVVSARPCFTDWSGHVRSWLNQSDVPVYLIRYEDLLLDPVPELRRALTFLGGRRVDDAAIELAVREAASARTNEVLPVGIWRQHLSVRQVRRLESSHAAMMDRLGYRIVTRGETAA